MDFVVTKVEPLKLKGPADVLASQLMSPFVWRPLRRDGPPLHASDTAPAPPPAAAAPSLAMMLRVVPGFDSGSAVTGRIFYAQGEADGLSFTLRPEPLIVPGLEPGALDALGCEDPTVVPTQDAFVVYYTGVNADGAGSMLYASGPDALHLAKEGVALASFKTESNTKEATVEVTDADQWRLFYEYANDNRSKIGLAFGPGPAGPWTEQPHPFSARPDHFDAWHLSTGPLLMSDPQRPVMFYNGSDADARWGIGWVAFDADLSTVIDRCKGPLVAPPDSPFHGREIVFAASVIADGDTIWLYGSRNDAELFRATLQRR